MHLGFDLLFLEPGRSGGRETYARELLTSLRTARAGLRVTTFVNRETAAAGPGFWTAQADRTIVLSRASAARRAAWALGEVASLPRAAATAGVDVLHSPANFGAWSGPFARVLTVHDLAHLDVPGATGAAARVGTDLLMRPAMRRAHRLLTGTEAVSSRLAALGVDPGRIDVVHHGASPVPAPRPDRAAARAAVAAGERLVALTVSTHLPHKNLPGLLDGLARVPVERRPLLLVAGSGTDSTSLLTCVEQLGLGDDVRLCGRQTPEALECLFAAADLLVTASLQEGFGLTVVEGMARGLAVAASDLAVLREVAGGDGAVWFDPEDPDDIARGLARLTSDDGLRWRLAGAGPARAAQFTWAASAARTLATYDRARASRAALDGARC